MNDRQIEKLWSEINDVPLEKDVYGSWCLAEDWGDYACEGEPLELILNEFNHHHSKGLNYLMFKDTNIDYKEMKPWKIQNNTI